MRLVDAADRVVWREKWVWKTNWEWHPRVYRLCRWASIPEKWFGVGKY